MKKRALFIDRDGTLIAEPADEQVDSLEKLVFVPGAIGGMAALSGLGYELVMVSNQDGLGTPAFPEETFQPVQDKLLQTLEGEGVHFDDILIDRSFPEENLPTRKPGTGMLGKYLDGTYDLAGSFVLGDRKSDLALARNLGATGLLIRSAQGAEEARKSWAEAVERIRCGARRVSLKRKTRETDISLTLDLDGKGPSGIDTGLKFFDHMLDQLVTHGGISLSLQCKGDLEVDEHHTIEDTAICLGTALREALGDKRGIGRYGFSLPMDDARALVLMDLGGRSELVWDVEFTREYVGDVPTEMFRHFFKSLSDALACNLYVQARGENTHHLAEAVFKAFARSLKAAVRRDPFRYELPSSKGLL